ncbi:type II toxin-antitoxin system VapC family toxin [Vacuolonema iberomarrocanum]|uniref:type II toxin-antitoxin system VapC family toxin n=1 Tax=Vacuolonema iberomarrocanum TaxID=3454632 RepID=UPI0019E437D5|nr:type II toxin-antitoxin system VapC family toxin [filamentous cyanobacterium LEGE 07170]
MSSLLLDTHAFIWLVEEDPKLPTSTKARINETQDVFVSIASFWEISIKVKKAQLFLTCEFDEIKARFLGTELQLLSISIQDTIQQYHLPFHLKDHKDPFDRLLISQAINRSLPIVSNDGAFDAYPIEKVWA